DQTMNLFPQTLQMLSSAQMTSILDFNFSDYNSQLFQTQLIIQNMLDSTKKIKFNVLNSGFSQYKGILVKSNSYSQISITLTTQFAIRFMIFPLVNNFFSNGYTFFQILDLSNNQVIAFNIYQVNFQSSRAKFKICLNFFCQITKYVSIKINDINQIFIQFNAENSNSRFCIVANYKYEELNFPQQVITQFTNLNSNIQIGTTYSGPIQDVFYFNNLIVYTGGFFYLDYDLQDPCFLYITKVDMECAIPKQGFTIKDGQAIQQNQCNYGRKSYQTVLYNNPFAMRCQDSHNVIPYCLQMEYTDTNQCVLCWSDDLNASNNCKCQDGTYLNLSLMKCLQCSPQCLTCSGTADNCIICKNETLLAPTCQCWYTNQFMKSDYTCEFCDPQCSQCIGSSSNCTVCSQDRLYPPSCRCNQAYFENKYIENISNNCRPLSCNFKCQKCLFFSDNCQTCRGNRIKPPNCICQEGFYEDPSTNQENCQQCPSGKYFDVQKNQCMNCYSNCSTCYGPLINNCLSCQKGLQLQDDKQCMCSYGSQAAQEFDPDFPCYYFMKLDYSITHKNQNFQINIKFQYPIDNLQQIIEKYGINNLFQLEISQIPSQYYFDINQYQIQSNSLLIIDVNILQNFQATEAFFLLKQNSVFRNFNAKKIVDSFYLQNPFKFNIGPYLLVLEERDEQMINAINQVTPQSTSIVQFLGSFQFLFYLLNSIQPTSLFLLIKINIPVNFYVFLSLFGTFVFKEMPQYQDNQLSQNLQFDEINVTDVLKSSGKYQRQKGIIINKSNKLKKLETFLVVRISKENEINLLMIVLSICIQVSQVEQQSWLSRWGYYVGVKCRQQQKLPNQKLSFHFSPKKNITNDYNILNVLSFIYAMSYCQTSGCDQVLLQKSLDFFDCQLLQYNSQIPSGNKILQSFHISVQKIRINGWFNLQGQNQQKYVLIEVKNLGLNVFQLLYDQQQSKFQANIFTSFQMFSDQLASSQQVLNKSWFFLDIGLNLADQAGKIYFYYIIWSSQNINGQQKLVYSQTLPSNLNQFDNKSFEIFIAQTTTVGYSFGCALIKQVTAYINQALNSNDSLGNLNFQDISLNAQIQVNIDFSIQPNTQDYLLNLVDQNQKIKIQQNLKTEEFNSLHSGENFEVGPVNMFLQDGITLAFDLKVKESTQIVSINNFLNIKVEIGLLQDYYSVLLERDSTNQNQFNYIEKNLNFLSGNNAFTIKSNTWVKIILFIHIQFGSIYRYLFIDQQYLSDVKQLSQPQSGNLYFQFQNNYLASEQKILFRSIKIYKGTKLFQCGNCLIQSQLNGSDCLVCQNSFKLLYSQFSYCVPNNIPCPNGFSDLDVSNSCIRSDQAVCNNKNQYKFYDSTCRCIIGQYYKQGNCFKCPSYCLDCENENSCKEFKDSVRNQQTDLCPQPYFDDGSKCIESSSQYYLPNIQNSMLIPPVTDTGCNNIYATPDWNSFLVQSDALQITKQQQSFIFGLRFQIYQTNYPAGKTFTLGLLRSTNYVGDVFLLMAQQSSTQGFGYIQFYFQNKLVISIPCVFGQPMWLGFVTDLNYLIVQTITSLQPIQTYRVYLQNSNLDTLQNPKFWYGVGMSKYMSSDYSMCSNIYMYTLIISIQNIMSIKDQDVLEFNKEGIITLYTYNFSQQNLQNQQNIKQFSFGANSNLIFTNLPTYDQVKGISITNSNPGQYSVDLTRLNFFFYMCSVYINQISQNVPIFQVIYDQSNLNQMLLSYRILYSSSANKAHLEICVVLICQVLYNTLNINEPNFILIRHENQAQNWNINIPYTQILVITNYQQKRLQFATSYPSGLDFSKITTFTNLASLQENEQVFYYINNIKIFSGGYLYMDYSHNTDCFIFVNRTNLACLIPKLGYALFNNQIIPSNSCTLQPLSSSNTQLYFNPLTFQCEDSFNYFDHCINIHYSNINSCDKCIDPNMVIVNGQCKCQSGMFWNAKQQKCLFCSEMCIECQDTDTNCTICRNKLGSPPSCQCPYLNQYLDSNFQCQQCQAKCQSCQQSSDNCLVCSVNRLLKTQCQCDLKYFKYATDINQPCQKIDCAFKCIGCTYFEDNCTLCRGNRINAPICSCPENFYEENPPKENCMSCPSHTYYDQKQSQCLQCDETCLECRGGTQTDCKKCAFGLVLSQNNQCKCPQGQSPQKDKNDQIICYSYFNLQFRISLKRIYYIIEIKFEQQIEGIIDSSVFTNNISIILSEVPLELYSYTFHSFDPQRSILQIQLIVNKSFQAIYGYLIFKTNKPFKNDSSKTVLNPVYTKQPMFFEIGPYLFILDETNKQAVINMGDKIDQIQGGNQNLLDFARNIQFLFYFLNSLQPIAMFLLVNAKLPQNFYTFLQLFSTFIFKRVPDYQVKEEIYNFTLLGNQIQQQDYIGPGSQVFVQLAFSDALLVNTFFILAKYVLIFLLYIILKIVKNLCFQEKYNYFDYKPEITAQKLKILQNKPIVQLMKQQHSNKVMQDLKPEQLPQSLNKNQKIHKQLQKIEQYLIYRILQENEINLLMVVFCISIQFSKTNQNIWLSRWSFYLALIYLAIYFTFFLNYVRIINGKNQYQIKLFTKEYDSRLSKKRNDYTFLRKNYHAIGMLKKVLLVTSIYFLVNFPMIISILGIALNSLSFIFSLRIMPFKKIYHNVIKIIGDLILTAVWCLMIYFIRFELDHKKQIEIDQSEVDRFIFIGNVASILVFILNILYLAQFIYDNIMYQLWRYLKKIKFCNSKKNQKPQGFSQNQQPQKQQIQKKETKNKASLPQIQLINDKKYSIEIKKLSIVRLSQQVSFTKKKQQSYNLDQMVQL
ncbi:hypothetical protein ABPG74_016601, partial [Tetrahymena malaccensis]